MLQLTPMKSPPRNSRKKTRLSFHLVNLSTLWIIKPLYIYIQASSSFIIKKINQQTKYSVVRKKSIFRNLLSNPRRRPPQTVLSWIREDTGEEVIEFRSLYTRQDSLSLPHATPSTVHVVPGLGVLSFSFCFLSCWNKPHLLVFSLHALCKFSSWDTRTEWLLQLGF